VLDLDEDCVFIYGITATPIKNVSSIACTKHALSLRMESGNIPCEENERQLVIVPLDALSPNVENVLNQSMVAIVQGIGLKWQLNGGTVANDLGTARKRTKKGSKSLADHSYPSSPCADGAAALIPATTPKASKRGRRSSSPSESESRAMASAVFALHCLHAYLKMYISDIFPIV
jgi:hypothetical protein